MPSDYKAITRYNEEQLGKDTASRKSQVNMYSDFSHFVYEILQNADDYGATTVTFKLNKNELVIEHNGIPFEEENVKAISYFGKSTSRDDLVKTGRFGLGFKSVFAFTASTAIHSGKENFEIYDLYRLKGLPHPHDLEPEKTRICLPFNHVEERPDFVETLVPGEKAFDKICRRLKKLDITTLLFTLNLSEIKWTIQDEEGHYLRGDTHKKNISEDFRARKTEITDGDTLHTYLVFSRSIKWHGKEYKPVEIAFFLDDSNKVERIRSTKKPLFVLFPTTQETKIGFLINGPFRTPAHRETVSQDDEFNQFLVEKVASLICDALPKIKEMGLLTVSFLEALPIRMDDFPEDGMFYPIVETVRDALMEQELLPADEGTFVSARNAKLASAEWLRTLLQEEQLKQLFKTENPLKWISGEITGARYDLWKYIREELKVEEVTPDSFARKVEGSLLEKQTDDWMNSFYAQLAGQKALWKLGSNSWYDKAGPLRAKEIIRLQDGFHVRPFKDDGSPNAFLAVEAGTDTSRPIVKIALSQNKDSLHFLRELEIPELDVVEEVIEILRRYSSPVTIDEHQRDIKKILKAYKTDSQEKKRRLIERLQATPFILTETPGIETTSFRRPIDAYFWNDELGVYFSANNKVSFVRSDYYDQSALALFKDLGVTDEIRIRCKSKNSSADYVQLEYKNGYRRGLRGFDPDIQIDGLKYAIMNPSDEGSKIIWNKIAVKYSHCIKGKILRSSRQDFSPNASTYKEDEITSKFGLLLIDKAWLPSPDESFVKPSELSLDDLPDSFIRDENLADQLGMKKDVVAKLAEEVGVSEEDIVLLKQHPEEFKKWKDTITAKKERPAFPTMAVTNSGRRQEKLLKDLDEAPEKQYEPRTMSVRITKASEYTRTWLKEQYTNELGQMICQICKEEMPFKKRDREYYFEAVEALSKDHFAKEHEAQFLALCPLCAAMYNEFVKHDEGAMGSLKNTLMSSEDVEVPLQLGELDTSIRFVESHWRDIRTILQKMG